MNNTLQISSWNLVMFDALHSLCIEKGEKCTLHCQKTREEVHEALALQSMVTFTSKDE